MQSRTILNLSLWGTLISIGLAVSTAHAQAPRRTAGTGADQVREASTRPAGGTRLAGTLQRSTPSLSLFDELPAALGSTVGGVTVSVDGLVDRGTIYSVQTGPEAQAASSGGEATVYHAALIENEAELGQFLNYGPTTGVAGPGGTWLADNLTLGAGFQPGDTISSYELRLFRSTLDPGVGPADIHVELWDGDPLCQIDTPGNGFSCALIPGTEADFVGLEVGERANFRAVLPKGVTAPHQRVWMVVSAASGTPNGPPCRLGWIIARVKPFVGTDEPGDFFELQNDKDGRANGGTCCIDGSACNEVDPICAFCQSNGAACLADADCPPGVFCISGAEELDRGFCSDGEAENAGLFNFGSLCQGDHATDFCSNFVAKVFTQTDTTISLVPVSATGPHTINGNEIVMESGQTVTLEVRLANWDPDGDGSPLVKAWQVLIHSSGYRSGAQGALRPFAPACTTDEDCAAPFGKVCGLSRESCDEDADCPFAPAESCNQLSECDTSHGQCVGVLFDTSRLDYIFFGLSVIPGVDIWEFFAGTDFRIATAATSGTAVDLGFPTYGATVVLEAPSDARGTFTVGFGASPLSALVDDDIQLIEPLGLVPARITVASNPLLRVQKNRYLTIIAGEPGRNQAIRVTFVDLPSPFAVRNGTSMWLGAPFDISENGHAKGPAIPGFADFKAASLVCEPFFTDWSALGGVVEVYHRDVVPGGTYLVDVFDEGDAGVPVTGSSTSFTIKTAAWGDLVGPFDSAGKFWPGPDGSVDIAFDVLAMFDTFRSLRSSPRKIRIDVEPAIPDAAVNITDVVLVLDAFRGQPYPFTPGPAPCG